MIVEKGIRPLGDKDRKASLPDRRASFSDKKASLPDSRSSFSDKKPDEDKKATDHNKNEKGQTTKNFSCLRRKRVAC